MRMRMSGSPRMAMRCPTCDQEIGGPVRDATANINANLFGAAKYAVCPNCNQVVPEHMQTSTYKTAWTKKNRTKVSIKDSPAAIAVSSPLPDQVARRCESNRQGP